MNTSRRYGIRIGAALAAAVIAAAPAGASVFQAPTVAPQLVSLAHVYNGPTPGGTGLGQGNDLDFWTADVPYRDYATGQLLDADGQPLPPGAAPVLVTRDFAALGSARGGVIYDITNPEAPVPVRQLNCYRFTGDMDVDAGRFGGRPLLLLTTMRVSAGSPKPDDICAAKILAESAVPDEQTHMVTALDVTDPYAPIPLFEYRLRSSCCHKQPKLVIHPRKPFVWVAKGPQGYTFLFSVFSGELLPDVSILDLSNPESPALAPPILLPDGALGVSFSPDGSRAYVAAAQVLRIFDATRPDDPTLIGQMLNLGTQATSLYATPDRMLMVASNVTTATSTNACPGEGLAFYQIQNDRERAPAPNGSFVPAISGQASHRCGAGRGSVSPNGRSIVTGWYAGGVRVIDITNARTPFPALPATEVGSAVMDNAEVEAVRYFKGPYLFAADRQRGLDVFKWSGTGAAPWTAT